MPRPSTAAARLPAQEEDSLGARLARASAPWRISRQLRLLGRTPRREDETFRFAVLGDAEPGRFWLWRRLFNVAGVFERFVRELQAQDIDFSIQLGDMVSRGSERNYLRFFRDLGRWGVKVPYLPVIGNHDRRSPHGRSDAALYRELVGPTDYMFDRGAARFVSLDTSAGRLTAAQLSWLDRVLETDRRKLVFTHMPPAPLRRWTSIGRARGLAGFSRGAREFVEVVSRRRVDRVYLGHIHAFGVQDFGGVRYILTGGGGSPLYPSWVEDKFHHYLLVEAGPGGVRETVRCADGKSLSIPAAKVVLA